MHVGSSTGFFDVPEHVPEHKDIDINAVVDVRRLLAAAGYEE